VSPTCIPALQIGRYILFEELASGGMATVHYGRLMGPAGFSRTVAIKRMHPTFAKNPEFLSMFLDEARIAARVRHPNVVATLDVVTRAGEVLLVMDYVQGVSLSQAIRGLRSRGEGISPAIAASIMTQVLFGLHAAHEARSDDGMPLGVVHRDVSPQNILIGIDGVARVADFGIAKAVGRLQTTTEGQIKGKTAYMAPEQIRGRHVDRRADVHAAGVVFWEALTGQRLFTGDSGLAVMNDVLEKVVPLVSEVASNVPEALDPIVARALSRDPQGRFATAREMAVAVESATQVASTRETGEWLEWAAKDMLTRRAARVTEIESWSSANASTPLDLPVHEPADGQGLTGTNHETDATPRSKSTRLALLLVAGLVGVVATVALLARGGGPSGTSPRPDPAASATSTASDPPSVSASTAPPVEASSPSSSATPTASPPVTKPWRQAQPSRPSPATRPLDCKPPYTMDKAGNRHWKDGC
jgi:eukaryotic-like serine/threonine-protein kinase